MPAVSLNEAIRYFELQQQGLGGRFFEEVLQVVALVSRHPEAAPLHRGELRRALVARFPYFLLYRRIANGIPVTVVAHQNRRPGYGERRR